MLVGRAYGGNLRWMRNSVGTALAAAFVGFLAIGSGSRADESQKSPDAAQSGVEQGKKPANSKPPLIAKPPFVPKKAAQPEITEECPAARKFVGGGADGSTRYCLKVVEQKAAKRCETAYTNYIKRNVETTISFDFRLDDSWDFHDVWTSIFQVHSHPDPDEQWRCPVTALEVQGHTLRMFNRNDPTPISTLINGTCADEGNSIRSRAVFAGVPIRAGQWNHFELKANFSLDKSGSFAVKLNNAKIGSLTGPNTYNDQHMPFVKIGIYKPSPWDNAKNLCVDYRNISIVSGKR